MGLGHGASIVRDGLVLYLDAANKKSYGGSGTVWNDLSGNGNGGTLVNSVGYNSNNNGSMVFDGVDDLITLNSSAQFGPDTPSFSIEIVYQSNINSIRTIPSTIYGRYRYYFDHVYTNNSARFAYVKKEYESSGSFVVNQLNFSGLNPKGSWNVLTVTYMKDGENGTLYGYVNGAYNGTSTATRISNYPLAFEYIGNSGHSSANYYVFDGNVGSVKIYNRILSNTEIQQNFNAIRGRYGI